MICVAILQHIVQIHQVAVVASLDEIIGVMEVNDAFPVCVDNIGVQQQPLGDVPGGFASNIVSLDRDDVRVLVGVLHLCLSIRAVDDAHDFGVGAVGLP